MTGGRTARCSRCAEPSTFFPTSAGGDHVARCLEIALSIALFAAGFLAASQVTSTQAAGDSWFETGNYWRTDPYGTDFYAQQAMWYDPYTDPCFGNGLYIWRTYLRMDVIYSSSSEYLNCDANDVSGSWGSRWERNWYNSPFPLDYYNTPAWDYFTHDGVRFFTAASQFGASRDEQCNLSASVPVGAWWSKASSGGSFSYGAWSP